MQLVLFGCTWYLPGLVGLPTSNWNKETRIALGLDDLSIMHRNKPIIVLLRRRLRTFWCRLGQFFNKPACRSYARQPLECLHQIENKPGEPRNTARAGTTVFGGSTVLSSIFAQSLIIQNFPCQIRSNVRSCHSAAVGCGRSNCFERNAERTATNVRMH